MTNAPKLADFAGDWLLTRRIEDRQAGANGVLEGRARFDEEAGGLLYFEEGALRLGDGPALTASRSYRWRDCAEGIEVFFEDGRPFHVIGEGKLMPDDLHHCAPDMYHVTYDFTAWPRWSAVWRVRGPRKDYRSVSDYRRG